MRTWNGTILGPGGTAFENRIISLKLYCDQHYPEHPPLVKFISRIDLACVKCAPPRPPTPGGASDPAPPASPRDGTVEARSFPVLDRKSVV